MAHAANIGLAHHRHGTHCGIFYESANGTLRFLHLAAQNVLKSDEPSLRYMVLAVYGLEDIQRSAISDMCRFTYGRYRDSIAYSPTLKEHLIPPNADLQFGTPGYGLRLLRICSMASGIHLSMNRRGRPLDPRIEGGSLS
jgi:hypothetical protein